MRTVLLKVGVPGADVLTLGVGVNLMLSKTSLALVIPTALDGLWTVSSRLDGVPNPLRAILKAAACSHLLYACNVHVTTTFHVNPWRVRMN